MKKALIMLALILVLTMILLAAMPAAPVQADWPGAPCGAIGGDPPGWSQVSRGEGGSGTPGVGPGAP
jgi:hypothetical protein